MKKVLKADLYRYFCKFDYMGVTIVAAVLAAGVSLLLSFPGYEWSGILGSSIIHESFEKFYFALILSIPPVVYYILHGFLFFSLHKLERFSDISENQSVLSKLMVIPVCTAVIYMTVFTLFYLVLRQFSGNVFHFGSYVSRIIPLFLIVSGITAVSVSVVSIVRNFFLSLAAMYVLILAGEELLRKAAAGSFLYKFIFRYQYNLLINTGTDGKFIFENVFFYALATWLICVCVSFLAEKLCFLKDDGV